MKKLFSMLAFFMMAMCVLTLSSCGDDDENESKANTAEILGSWEETKQLQKKLKLIPQRFIRIRLNSLV